MGVGKSTVGALLAKRLRRPFIDLDLLIEAMFQKPVEHLFAQGEEIFRLKETEALKEASQHNAIIATGGGASLREENRSLMKSTGDVVYLYAEFSVILKRLAKNPNYAKRPLLRDIGSSHNIGNLKSLFENRLLAYSFAQIKIDTTYLSIDEVVAECAKFAQK